MISGTIEANSAIPLCVSKLANCSLLAFVQFSEKFATTAAKPASATAISAITIKISSSIRPPASLTPSPLESVIPHGKAWVNRRLVPL
jgi:hypothetical protein